MGATGSRVRSLSTPLESQPCGWVSSKVRSDELPTNIATMLGYNFTFTVRVGGCLCFIPTKVLYQATMAVSKMQATWFVGNKTPTHTQASRGITPRETLLRQGGS